MLTRWWLVFFCWWHVFLLLPRVEAQTVDNLPPCNFNAYTDRSDLIIGAVVLNLETGEGCTQNINTSFQVASVGKIFIAAALYEKIARGEATFDTQLVFTPDYFMNGRDDCLNESRLNQPVTLADLGNMMIWCSDNASTWMLMDYLGWDVVNQYIDNLGIEGIGDVIPYSEVDRIKLSLIDPHWSTVPRNLASQFYRRRYAEGLVPTYFNVMPSYSQHQLREANAFYQAAYSYNTMTPQAMLTYLNKLRDDVQRVGTPESLVAQYVFNTMLLTDRMFSTQALPGNIYAGSKNGFDIGIRAEVNITVDSLDEPVRVPQTFSIIFVRYRDILQSNVPYRLRGTPIEELLHAISPKITRLLYPEATTNPPVVEWTDKVSSITFNARGSVRPCFDSYQTVVSDLQGCWSRLPILTRFSVDEWLGLGVVLKSLNGMDARLTLVYILPDGTQRSYQTQYFYQNEVGISWYEPLDVPGEWRLDLYFNLVPIFTHYFVVD